MATQSRGENFGPNIKSGTRKEPKSFLLMLLGAKYGVSIGWTKTVVSEFYGQTTDPIARRKLPTLKYKMNINPLYLNFLINRIGYPIMWRKLSTLILKKATPERRPGYFWWILLGVGWFSDQQNRQPNHNATKTSESNIKATPERRPEYFTADVTRGYTFQ